jgi:hypothetical protein
LPGDWHLVDDVFRLVQVSWDGWPAAVGEPATASPIAAASAATTYLGLAPMVALLSGWWDAQHYVAAQNVS